MFLGNLNRTPKKPLTIQYIFWDMQGIGAKTEHTV
jgi:hypothetical protein